MKKIISVLLSFAILFNVTACGTLMHPERTGQPRGTMNDIDARVAWLNTLAMFFFIIPGVIAYAVDFGNGAIYLPVDERKPHASNLDEMRKIKLGKENMSAENIRKVILEETGKDIGMGGANAGVYIKG